MQTTENQTPSALPRPFTFDRVVRLLITVAVLAAAIWLIDTLKAVLLPFLVAWVIAYLLEPFVQYNSRLLGMRKRWLPVFMTLFEAILLVTVAAMFLVPSIIDETRQMSEMFSTYSRGHSSIPFVPESVHEFLQRYIDFGYISEQLRSQTIDTWLGAIGSVVSGGYDVVMWIFSCFLVLLYVVFIMLDYERLLRGFKRMVPPKYRAVTFSIASDVKNSMNHYFRGQALVATCVGVLFAIGLSIVGLPLAVVLGLFIGLLNMVPYLQLISIPISAVLCLVYAVDTDASFWLIFGETMLVYVVVQCIQDLLLTPKIMGKAMGLNPAVMLLSLSVWGTLLGFIGLIIALPLTTLLLAYYERYVAAREEDLAPASDKTKSTTIKRLTK